MVCLKDAVVWDWEWAKVEKQKIKGRDWSCLRWEMTELVGEWMRSRLGMRGWTPSVSFAEKSVSLVRSRVTVKSHVNSGFGRLPRREIAIDLLMNSGRWL